MYIFRKILSFCFIALLSFLALNFLNTKIADAQVNSIGIATSVPISGKVEDGDIIVATENGYKLSNTAYETRLIGVISLNPAIVVNTDIKGQNQVPIIKDGIAYVKVRGETGNIVKGDFITSSSVAGTGMKAQGSGTMLGIALDSANFNNENEIKLIQIDINPRSVQASSSLLDIFTIGKLAASEKPSKVLQYLVAGIITLVTFGSGFIIFSKTVNTGLEALGRNPLAGRQIQLGIIFNIILIVVIIIAGAGLAYIVIRL